jgi:hypothetical protein
MSVVDTHSLLADLWRRLPPPRQRDGLFSVESFLHGLRSAADIEQAGVAEVLEALSRKVEVARRLRAFYRPDFRNADETLVAEGYPAYLCAVDLLAAQTLPDYKFLNCALKMLDGILVEPTLAPELALDAWAEDLLRA